MADAIAAVTAADVVAAINDVNAVVNVDVIDTLVIGAVDELQIFDVHVIGHVFKLMQYCCSKVAFTVQPIHMLIGIQMYTV